MLLTYHRCVIISVYMQLNFLMHEHPAIIICTLPEQNVRMLNGNYKTEQLEYRHFNKLVGNYYKYQS